MSTCLFRSQLNLNYQLFKNFILLSIQTFRKQKCRIYKMKIVQKILDISSYPGSFCLFIFLCFICIICTSYEYIINFTVGATHHAAFIGFDMRAQIKQTNMSATQEQDPTKREKNLFEHKTILRTIKENSNVSDIFYCCTPSIH